MTMSLSSTVSEASDVDILVHGMKLAKAVVRQMASDGYAVSPHGKNNPFFDEKGRELSVSDAELGAYARKWATNACKSSGTPLSLMNTRANELLAL